MRRASAHGRTPERRTGGTRGGALLLLAAGLAAAAPAAAQTRTVQRGIAATPDILVRIHNYVGSVRVEAWDRDSVAAMATLSDAGAAQFFFGGSRTGVKMGLEPGTEADQPPAHLVLRVPSRARVWIKSGAADAVLLGLAGGVDVFGTSGSIRFDGRPDQLTLETLDGTIDANATASWIRIKSASGDITLRGSGEDVGVSSVSGNITLLSTGLRRARVESVSGALTFRGSIAPDGALTVETHSGAADLQLPVEAGINFDLSTYQGTITTDFPGAGSPRPEGSGLALRFDSGPGPARVTVRTFKGAIVLSGKR